MFENVLQTNVGGVWLAMKLSIGSMKAQGGGPITATASAAGLIGFPGFLLLLKTVTFPQSQVNSVLSLSHPSSFGVSLLQLGQVRIVVRLSKSLSMNSSPGLLDWLL